MTQSSYFPVHIAGFGLCSAHDMKTLDALRAIATDQSAKIRHPVFVGADGLKQLCAPVPSCVKERNTIARVSHLAIKAQNKLGKAGRSPALSFLLLPSLLGPRSPLYPETQKAIQDRAFGFEPDHIVFGGSSTAANLMRVIARSLSIGEAKNCMLVCADTFVSPFMLDILEANGLSYTRSRTHTPVPGEMGVALFFRPAKPGNTMPGQTLTDLQVGSEMENPEEPNRGLLGRASVAPLQALGDVPEGTKLVIDTDGPRHKAEELGVILSSSATIKDTDLVSPSTSIGTVGCATLPMALGLSAGLIRDGAPCVVSWICGEENERILVRVD
ncbi:MAG: hypothetical protein AAGF15_04355 [Pseudomonadota bacterium]